MPEEYIERWYRYVEPERLANNNPESYWRAVDPYNLGHILAFNRGFDNHPELPLIEEGVERILYYKGMRVRAEIGALSVVA